MIIWRWITQKYTISGQPHDPTSQNPNPDEDPLPNEENSENASDNEQSHNDLVTINVSNEFGVTKSIGNGYDP